MMRAELITAARGWVGVPFVHQGRSRSGVDCVGYVISLMSDLGLLPADFAERTNYGRVPADSELQRAAARYMVPVTAREPGAMALIRWPGTSLPSHVGILTGTTIIHAYQRARGVVEQSYGQPWLRLTHSLWRLPGVDP